MTKCKKLLIALLSVVCIVTCALGLVACGGGGGDTYTAKVTVYGAETPVANVWLEFFHIVTRTVEAGDNVEADGVGQTYTVQETLAKAKTDANGVAKFTASNKAAENLTFGEFNPVAGATYYVKPAQYGATENERSVPYNYSLRAANDPATGLPVTYFGFDEEKNVAVKYDYLPNHFRYSERLNHPYYREYVYDNSGDPFANPNPEYKEGEDKTLQLNVKAGQYAYFDLSTFKNPRTVATGEPNPLNNNLPYTEDEARQVSQAILNMAVLAATGNYKVTVSTTTPSASPTLRQFAASEGFTAMDENGIPTGIIASATSAANSAIDLEIAADRATAYSYFYVTSSVDCTVTVNVQRTGDITQREDTDKVTVTAKNINSNTPKYIMEKTLTLVPVDGTANAVYNSEDGYYHLNSADGKIILVMLTKNDYIEERVGDALNSWDSYGINNVEENKIYDYSAVINAYANVANADGVYALTQDLYEFLQAFKDRFMGALDEGTDPECRWLLPCVYYKEENPAITLGTDTNIEYEGENVLFTFRPENDGWYAFENVVGEITFIGLNGNNFTDYKARPFYAEAGKKYILSIEFNEDEAIYGDTYTVKLVDSDGTRGTLNVSANQAVELDSDEMLMKFTGESGEYTITIAPNNSLLGQTITLLNGGLEVTLAYDETNHVFTATVTLAKDAVLTFGCETVSVGASIEVTIAAATAG